MKAIFDGFAAAYGLKWTRHISDPAVLDASLRLWSRALSDLTNEQIKTGIRKITMCDEWVSISSFRKAALGVIDPESAWVERSNNGLAKEAWNKIDPWRRKTATEKEIKSEFLTIYNNLAEKKLTGG